MTRHYKPKEPKREMIRAVQYTYTTTNGRRLARRTVCDLEEVKPCGKDFDKCCCYRCVLLRNWFTNKRVFVEKND